MRICRTTSNFCAQPHNVYSKWNHCRSPRSHEPGALLFPCNALLVPESHWVWWRLGRLDFDQGLVGPRRSVERLLELCWRDVGQVAMQAVMVVPVDPAESREFDVLDGLPRSSF